MTVSQNSLEELGNQLIIQQDLEHGTPPRYLPTAPKSTDEILENLAGHGIVCVRYLLNDNITHEELLPYSADYHDFLNRVYSRITQDYAVSHLYLDSTRIIVREDMWQRIGPMEMLDAKIVIKTRDSRNLNGKVPGCTCVSQRQRPNGGWTMSGLVDSCCRMLGNCS